MKREDFSNTKLHKVGEILGIFEESHRGKDWLLEQTKKHKISVKNMTNSFEILKECPDEFISKMLDSLSGLDVEGYEDIKTAETGHAGVTLFKQFVQEDITPLVLLDYNLPDSTANSIMSQILPIKPFTKIIIETANGKEEESIKEVIGLGAYHYLQKPIHFNDVERIITILEEEESYLGKKSQHKELPKDDDIDKGKIIEHIDFILTTTNQISLNKIKQILGFSNDFIEEYLKKLESKGTIVQLDSKKEIACV